MNNRFCIVFILCDKVQKHTITPKFGRLTSNQINMKKITQTIFLLICSIGFSQNAPVNFESGGFGAGWTFTVFENATNPAVEVIANPHSNGINTSATVAKYTALQTGMPWAGFESMHAVNTGTFNLTTSNCVVKMMVYKTTISDVGIKFATATGDSTGEIKVANTLINQWEELTFNFAGKVGEASSANIDQIVIFPDFTARTSDNVVYIDNITFSAGTISSGDPVVGAPNPTLPQADVMSLFSNVYTNVPVLTWKTDWSSAVLEETQIAGNDTKKYTSLNFAGIETTSPQLNITGMTHFNISVWSPNFSTFKIKLVDFGADGAYQGGDDAEHEITYNSPLQNQWVTYHIPISSFTNLTTKEHITQLILSSSGAKVYVDNVYFSNEVIVIPATDPTVAAPTPTAAQVDVMSMFSNAYTNVPVDTWKTEWSEAALEEVQIAGNDTKKYTNLSFVGIETVTSQLDITSKTFLNVDVWSPDFTVFKIKLVDFGANGVYDGGDDKEHEVTYTAPAQSQWITYHIPLANFENLTTRQHIAQLIFAASGSKVYIDNVYFSSEPVVVIPTDPTVAAPTPILPANQVMSLFSNAYTNVPVDTWKTVWSDATLAEVQIAGNDVKKYTGLNFVGIETTNPQLNITPATHFNVDVWSPNFTLFKIKLVDFGANGVYDGGDDKEHELVFNNPAQNQWITYHIPLTDFVNLTTREHISQLIFASTGSKVYIDNVYFSSNVPLGVTQNNTGKLKMFPNPTQAEVHFSAPELIENITIYNILGQQIKSVNPNSKNMSIDVSSLSKGIYVINTLISGKVRSEKLAIK